MSTETACYNCGARNPDFTTDGYSRSCSECDVKGTVLTITEMCDYMFDLDLRGYINHTKYEDFIDEDFDKIDLDFSDDEQTLAYNDAYKDYLEEDEL